MNLSKPRALFTILAVRLEMYTNITDDTSEAMAANYNLLIEYLEEGVENLSNRFTISYQNLLDKPVLS